MYAKLYRKIDIYVGGQYVCSTRQAPSLAEAKQRFMQDPRWMGLGGVRSAADLLIYGTVTVKYAED